MTPGANGVSPNGADDPTGSIVGETTRDFTGQEELSVGLVHLNGRAYDQLLARMLSADPVVPDAFNTQAWNRYSYVGNDPLKFTDPNDFSWLSRPGLRSLNVAMSAAMAAGEAMRQTGAAAGDNLTPQ